MTIQTKYLYGDHPIFIDFLTERRTSRQLKAHAQEHSLLLRKGVRSDQEIENNQNFYFCNGDLWLQAEWATSNTNPQLNFQDYAELEAKRTLFFVQRQAEWIQQELAKYPQATQKTARYIQKQADARFKEECDIWRELFWHSDYGYPTPQNFYFENLQTRKIHNFLYVSLINASRGLRSFNEAIRTSEGSISGKTYLVGIIVLITLSSFLYISSKLD